MPNILALDAATEVCSVALMRDGVLTDQAEHLPRQHNQRLFPMLQAVLGSGDLAAQGIGLLAYNHGPGSFTGLRIAASAIQGLAYSQALPVVGVSTLACMAQGAFAKGIITEGDVALVLLDARINELYYGCYQIVDGLARPLGADAVGKPEQLEVPVLPVECSAATALGNGLAYWELLPAQVRSVFEVSSETLWPWARDIIPLAAAEWEQGAVLRAEQVIPVYLRDDVGWKKLAEQGKRNS